MARKKKKAASMGMHMEEMANVPEGAMAEKEERSEEDRDRDGRYDLDTLLAAEEIRNNPEKMKYAMAHGKKKMAAITSIEDLKTVREAKFGGKKK